MVDIVLDSSVIIDLAQLTNKSIKKITNPKKLPLVDIIRMLINEEINIIVPQTVYKEIKRGKVYDNGLAQRFLTDSCEVLQPSQEEKDLSAKLLYDYGNLRINGRTAVYLAENKTQENYKDARIVSEISVEQKYRNKSIPFVTANLRDIRDVKRINEVNKLNGLPEIFIFPLSKFKEALQLAQREEEQTKEI